MYNKTVEVSKRRGLSEGFTLIEVALVVTILGMLLTIGVFAYSNISKNMNLEVGKKQVGAAIDRAKLSSRQENVDYRIIFYPDTDPSHPNTYEFLHAIYNAGDGSWSLQPIDKSVAGEKVVAEGGHYYIEVNNPVTITSGTAIDFHPSGTMFFITSIPESEGYQAIGLSVGASTGTVYIDAEGAITQE